LGVRFPLAGGSGHCAETGLPWIRLGDESPGSIVFSKPMPGLMERQPRLVFVGRLVMQALGGCERRLVLGGRHRGDLVESGVCLDEPHVPKSLGGCASELEMNEP